MRAHRKILSLVLALALCLGLGAPAFAWEPPKTWSNSQIIARLGAPATEAIAPENGAQAEFWRSGSLLYLGAWEGDKSVDETLADVKALAQSLTKNAGSETEKARAIFDWVSSNITYGTPGEHYENHEDGLSTFFFRKGQCDGYTKLANLMLAYAGLTAARITGLPQYTREPHGWSAVYADGRWVMFDATWGDWDISPDFHKEIHTISVPYGPILVEVNNGTGKITAEMMKNYDCPSELVIPEQYHVTEIPWIGFGMGYGKKIDGLTTVVLPEGLTTIGDSAFQHCGNLTSITLPDSLTNIEQYAFSYCGLESVTLPKNVAKIEHGAFHSCNDLREIEVDPDNSTFTSVDGVVLTRSGTLVVCPNGKEGVYVAPENVTAVADEAFRDCEKLTDIILPDGVTTLGSSAFMGFEGNVTLPDSIVEISTSVFSQTKCNIYFKGTEAQWQTIAPGINEKSWPLKIHYNSAGPAAGTQTTTPEPPKPTGTTDPAQGTAYAASQTVKVDGRDIGFQCYALKDEKGNATNYIKLRDLAILLNGSAAQFQVGWDGGVTITTGTAYTPNGTELSTPYSGNRPYRVVEEDTKVNGRAVKLAAFVLTDDKGGGYTYYQLRDLGRALGFNVGWSAEKGMFIETDRSYHEND